MKRSVIKSLFPRSGRFNRNRKSEENVKYRKRENLNVCRALILEIKSSTYEIASGNTIEITSGNIIETTSGNNHEYINNNEI